MIEIIRDPMWQFIGGLLAIATAFYIYYLQRQNKSLSYEIISQNKLLTISEELEGRIKILFDDQPTKDISLLTIRFFNSGNSAIPAIDYEQPTLLILGDDTKILSSTVANTNPNNLKAEIQVKGNKISIKPCLLNASDSMTIKLLMTDFNNKIEFDARVTGVRKIRNLTNKASRYDITISILLIAISLIPSYYFITSNFIERVLASSPMMQISGFSIIFITTVFYLWLLISSFIRIRQQLFFYDVD